jgi:hypothetical protein
MLKILPASDTNVLSDGVFIWDARNTSQYSAGETSANTITSVADYMTTFQNSGSRQGHPNGALQLDFTNMLVAAEGYRYKDKAEFCRPTLDGNVSGAGFIAGMALPRTSASAMPTRPGDVIYTYCETTFRAMITGVVSAVILGKPTRFYDGAMVEWNSLTPGSVITDATGNAILPEDSPWRTDVKSFFRRLPQYPGGPALHHRCVCQVVQRHHRCGQGLQVRRGDPDRRHQRAARQPVRWLIKV